MSTTLTPRLRQQLQAQLLARRADLAAQRSTHLAGESRADHARAVLLQDGDDATQHAASRSLDLDRTDRDAVALAEIDQALQRLHNGSYGLCSDCGAPVAVARLRAAPQAQRCVGCEALLERGRARPARL